MNLFYFFVFSTLFGFSKIYSQNCQCSEKERLETTIDSLIEIGEFKQALKLNNTLIKSEITPCKAYGYGNVGEVLLKQGFIDSAKKAILFAESLFENGNCTFKSYKFSSQKALLHYSENDYQAALENSLKSLEIAISEGKGARIADSYIRIANIFVKMGQPLKARDYTVKARQQIEKLPESFKKYYLYNMLANRYNNLFQDFKDKRFLDTIETFMIGIRSHALKNGKHNRLIEQYYRKKAFLALKTKELDLSYRYLDSALEVLKHYPIPGELYSINGDKANILRKQKKFEEAEIFADSCLFYAKQVGTISSIINGYDIIYLVAKDKGNFEKALMAFENLVKINDSITGVKNTSKIAELEQKYNKFQNEKTIRELSQDSEIKNLRIKILLIAIGFTILMIFTISFYFRQRLIKSRQLILETEQRLNRSRINPHFFFNALTTLQGIALKENDGKKVALNLYNFSSLMRQTLESTYSDYVSINEEMEFTNKYIQLQQLKEGNKFTFKYECDDKIESDELLVPSMLIQPFLENSIEHGFKNINYVGKIYLQFIITNNMLNIVVKDNGSGISQSKVKEHVSRATQITTDRLYLLNQKTKSNASFTIRQIETGGTQVEILLPLMYK